MGNISEPLQAKCIFNDMTIMLVCVRSGITPSNILLGTFTYEQLFKCTQFPTSRDKHGPLRGLGGRHVVISITCRRNAPAWNEQSDYCPPLLYNMASVIQRPGSRSLTTCSSWIQIYFPGTNVQGINEPVQNMRQCGIIKLCA